MIRIEPLEPDRRGDAARVLARAFVTNPLHIAAFGANEIARNEAFFQIGLGVMKGPMLAALDGPRIVGALHFVRSPSCQFSALEKLRMLPAMAVGFGPGPLLRVSAWLSAWSRHEPSEAHVHLGPIGVLPEVQGKRVGGQLMQRYCDDQDQSGLIGYLETDRLENVAFYERFGFKTTGTAAVLGVTNYFMRRTP